MDWTTAASRQIDTMELTWTKVLIPLNHPQPPQSLAAERRENCRIAGIVAGFASFQTAGAGEDTAA